MAKGNMLLGYSRGSVGDVTFYRDGGEQRARARNRKPNNPRSNRQMYQRAKFAGAVKFFKQSLANFYKMAFENKKPNESDYNAFMRVNLAQSPLMSKTAFDKAGYPAIGHWTIAQGSMPTLQFFKNYGTGEDKLAVVLPVQTEETISNNTTIGEFSTILINSGLYQPGDIFTVVRVRVDADTATLATLPTATPEGNWNSYWFVTQIILDTADTRKVGTELLREDAGELLFKNSDNNIYIGNSGDDGFSLVTTRNTPNGLKASNSEIVVTDTIDAAITTAEGDNYKNDVLADWRASGENILQGALADPFEPGPWDMLTKTYWDAHFTNNSQELIIQDVTGVETDTYTTGAVLAGSFVLNYEFTNEMWAQKALETFDAYETISASHIKVLGRIDFNSNYATGPFDVERTGNVVSVTYGADHYQVFSTTLVVKMQLSDKLLKQVTITHTNDVDIFEIYNSQIPFTDNYEWKNEITGMDTQYNNRVYLRIKGFNTENATRQEINAALNMVSQNMQNNTTDWQDGGTPGVIYNTAVKTIIALPAPLQVTISTGTFSVNYTA